MALTTYERLAVRASNQHGLFTTADAISVGFTDKTIKHLAVMGRVICLARNVYRFAGVPPTWEQRVLAACLTEQGKAFASYSTAAYLQRLTSELSERIELTVAYARSIDNPLALVHRSRAICDADVTSVRGIPCTTAARTIVDLAIRLPRSALNSILDQAILTGRTTPKAIVEAAERVSPSGRRAGMRTLRWAVMAWTDGALPDSAAEMRFIRRIVEAGVPTPDRQINVRTAEGRIIGRIDLGWERHRVGLEYQGIRWHSAPDAVVRDSARMVQFVGAGWTILPVTKQDVRDPAALLAVLRPLLATPVSALDGHRAPKHSQVGAVSGW